MAMNTPAVVGNLDTITTEMQADHLAAELADITREIRLLIRAWSRGDPDVFGSLFSDFFGRDRFGGHRRFGSETWHEQLWHAWCPSLESQVTFGTGKGGLKRWGCTSFTADFFDRERGAVYEIDGSSHRGPDRKERDSRKDAFLWTLGRYVVIRVTNSEIEQTAEQALVHVAKLRLGLEVTPDPVLVWKAKPLQRQIARLFKNG